MRALSQSREGREKCLDDFSQAFYWVVGGKVILSSTANQTWNSGTSIQWFHDFPLTRGLDLPCPHASQAARVPFLTLTLSLPLVPFPRCSFSTFAWRQMMEEGSELSPTLAFTPEEDLQPCSTEPAALNDKIRKKPEKREAEKDQDCNLGNRSASYWFTSTKN